MNGDEREKLTLEERLKALQATTLKFSDELLFLNETFKELSKSLDLQEVMERFLQSVLRFTSASSGAVFLYQENRGVIKVKTADFPEDADFLCVVSEMTEDRKTIAVNEKTCLEALEGGTLEVWCQPLIWNVKGAVLLYFQEGPPELPEPLGLLMEVGFFTLRNALTFDFTRKSQELWQLVMDEIPDFIFLIDEDQVVIKCNMAFASMLSVHPRKIVGKRLHELALREEMGACIY
ncbi:MAG: PAS domain-containing protein, partial [Nitrospirae bacterium]